MAADRSKAVCRPGDHPAVVTTRSTLGRFCADELQDC